MTPPQAPRRGLGNLTCLESKEGAQLWPYKPSFLGREVGTGLRGERGWCSLFFAETTRPCRRGQRTSCARTWPWHPQRPPGGGLGMGCIMGKRPFPPPAPMFPALEHENCKPVTGEAGSGARSPILTQVRLPWLSYQSAPGATSASAAQPPPELLPRGPDRASSLIRSNCSFL